MSRLTGIIFLIVAAVVGAAGQTATALGYVAIGVALAAIGVGLAAIAKMPEVMTGKVQHPYLVLGLLISGVIATAAAQYLTAIGQVGAGASLALLATTLAAIAKMGDLLGGGGPSGGVAAGGAAA